MLGDLLPWLLSRIDAAKRTTADNIGGLLTNPAGQGSVLLDQMANSLEDQFGPQRQGESKKDYWNRMALSGSGLLGAIKVFHGSPHTFSKFDMSKIGTGEGAQAYGHGLYFAENPGVAVDYKNRLSEGSVSFNGKKVAKDLHKAGTVEDLAMNAMYTWPGSPERAAKKIREAVKNGDVVSIGEDPSLWLKSASWLEDNSAKIKAEFGNLYEASLRWPDAAREARDPLGPQHFLQWDKPLSEQPAKVKDFAKTAIAPQIKSARETLGPGWGDLGDPFDPMTTWTGSDLVSMIRDKNPDFLGGGGPGASNKLLSAGIPGIRYLDAGSRGTGQGTANYVVFDPNLIEILKRNGQPIGGLLNP